MSANKPSHRTYKHTHRKMNAKDIILHCTKCSEVMIIYYASTKTLVQSKQLICRKCGNHTFKVFEVK